MRLAYPPVSSVAAKCTPPVECSSPASEDQLHNKPSWVYNMRSERGHSPENPANMVAPNSVFTEYAGGATYRVLPKKHPIYSYGRPRSISSNLSGVRPVRQRIGCEPGITIRGDSDYDVTVLNRIPFVPLDRSFQRCGSVQIMLSVTDIAVHCRSAFWGCFRSIKSAHLPPESRQYKPFHAQWQLLC